MAGTSKVCGTGIEHIPGGALHAIGAIFEEGDLKYPGRDNRPNWHRGAWLISWVQDRIKHQHRHRMLWQYPFLRRLDGTGESDLDTADHLAKAAWFDTVVMEARVNPDLIGSPLEHYARCGTLREYRQEVATPTWAAAAAAAEEEK